MPSVTIAGGGYLRVTKFSTREDIYEIISIRLYGGRTRYDIADIVATSKGLYNIRLDRSKRYQKNISSHYT